MKNVIERIFSHIKGVSNILFIIYTTIIFGAYIFIQKSILPDDFLLKKISYLRYAYMVRHILIAFVLSVAFCPLILKFFSKLSFPYKPCDEKKKCKIIFFLIPFLVFMIYYIGYYPGGFGNDFFDQYRQVMSNHYTDWHPVIQTLYTIKLPLILTGGWIGSIVLMQIIVFSAIIAYSIYSIMLYHGKKIALFSLAFIMINPTVANSAIMPLKDTVFAMFSLLLVTLLYKTYCTNGDFLKKNRNLILVICLTAFITLTRHNAVLFTIPVVIFILCYLSTSKKIITALSILGIIVLVKYPIYSWMNVEKPNQRKVETLGLPMTVIGAVAKYDPESLDDETKDFIYKVAPSEVWEEKYIYGGYNYVKYDERTNNDIIEEYGVGKIISMMFKCIVKSPRHSLTALFRLTDGVYGFMDDHSFLLFPDMKENDLGITQSGIPFLTKVNFLYTSVITVLLPFLFSYVGMAHYILIVLILSKCKLNALEDWKKILFVLPVFCYNFGTMLLLTYNFDCHRFFWYTFLLMPTFVCLFLGEKEVDR